MSGKLCHVPGDFSYIVLYGMAEKDTLPMLTSINTDSIRLWEGSGTITEIESIGSETSAPTPHEPTPGPSRQRKCAGSYKTKHPADDIIRKDGRLFAGKGSREPTQNLLPSCMSASSPNSHRPTDAISRCPWTDFVVLLFLCYVHPSASSIRDVPDCFESHE